MERFEELKKNVRNLISNNKTQKALELLAKESLSTIDKKLILLHGRYKKIEDDLTFGIIDDDEARQEINKINLALLDLSEEIGNEPQTAKSKKEVDELRRQVDTGPTKNKMNIWYVLIPSLALLLAVIIIVSKPWQSSGDGHQHTENVATDTGLDPTKDYIGVTEINPAAYYILTTAFQGDEKQLDVVQVDNYYVPYLSSDSHSLWSFTPLGDGYYNITSESYPGYALDILNDEYDESPVLFESDGAVGQSWRVTYEESGYFRINNKWDATAGKSLDVINDDNPHQLYMAESGPYSGQFWKLIER